MVQKITIEAEIKASRDANSFNQAKKEVEQIWKGLDNALDVEINRAKLVEQLKSVNAELRKTTDASRRIELQIDARRIRGEISWVEKEIKKLEGRTGGLQKAFVGAFTQIGIAAASAFSLGAIGRFIWQTFTLASQVESARQSFVTLTGSIEGANKLLAEIDAFAARTPFNKLGIVGATQRLIGFWFAAEDAVGTLEAVGNAVAAVGGTDETLNWVIAALWQIEAKGKLSTEEVLQIAERGIPIFDILRNELGLTEEELWNIGNAGIKASEAIPTILEALQTRFGWSLEAQAQTLQGQLSNLIDSFQNLAAQIGERLRPVFEFLLQAWSNLITFFTNFGDSVGIAAAWVWALWLAFWFLTWPIGIALAAILWVTSALWFLSDWLNGVSWATDTISKRYSNLQSELSWVQKQIQELDKAFQEWSITSEEYATSQAQLQNKSNDLTQALELEAAAVNNANKEYFDAQKQIAENDKQISNLTWKVKVAEDATKRLHKLKSTDL